MNTIGIYDNNIQIYNSLLAYLEKKNIAGDFNIYIVGELCNLLEFYEKKNYVNLNAEIISEINKNHFSLPIEALPLFTKQVFVQKVEFAVISIEPSDILAISYATSSIKSIINSTGLKKLLVVSPILEQIEKMWRSDIGFEKPLYERSIRECKLLLADHIEESIFEKLLGFDC